MRRYLTDETFVAGGVPRAGMPFFCGADMELQAIPNAYLEYVVTTRGRTQSPRTWLSYSDHLLDYLDFCESNGVDWLRATEADIALWRDSMRARGNSTGTINQRLRTIQRMYMWAVRHDHVPGIPFHSEDLVASKGAPMLVHVDASAGRRPASELTLREQRKIPQFLHVGQAIKFLDALSPSRLRLMGYVMLLTGMRREEVVELDCGVLPNPAGQAQHHALKMTLEASTTKTKGGKTRTVMLPFQLAEKLYDYLTWARPKLARLHRAATGVEPTRLFLSQLGEPLSLDGLSIAFLQASQRTGIKCTPHMLRHTFATYELLRMSEKTGSAKALHWVRDRLGHTSIKTTEVYLHLADMLRNDEVDGYVAEVCEALAHGT